MSARSDLADWQIPQMVDALRLLLVDLAQVPCLKGVERECSNETRNRDVG